MMLSAKIPAMSSFVSEYPVAHRATNQLSPLPSLARKVLSAMQEMRVRFFQVMMAVQITFLLKIGCWP